MQEPKTMDRTEWGLLVLLSVLWGGAFFCVGVAVVELPPLTVVLARVGLAALILLGLSWFLGHSLPRGMSAWWPFLVMGLLNNVVPFSFLNAGQTMVSVGLASIMNAMTPLFTALVVAGAATIGLGLLFIDGRVPRRAMRVTATRVTAGRRRR